jgi:hypothetical protein
MGRSLTGAAVRVTIGELSNQGRDHIHGSVTAMSRE